MLFTSITFALFFGVILLGLAILRRARWQQYWLLAGSYFFYGWWDWRFCFLMAFSTLSAYATGRVLDSYPKNDPRRARLLAFSVGLDLVILGWFKYANFFLDTLAPALHALGWRIGALSIVLPVGISFYTFEVIGYKIDVRRGATQATQDWLKIGLFLAFFPRLVAGPIMRARQFLPQLDQRLALSRANAWAGGQQFALGVCKKVLIADRLAFFVDPVLATPDAYSPLTVWLAMISYAVQIYCDFSGYSDMALGLARIMGVSLPENFNLPYLATSMREFWRRWHISLSTWLTDYIYFGLGGLRQNRFNLYRNLLITMLLGGLWHGAKWNFVVWGGLHGLMLCAEHAAPVIGRSWRGPRLWAWEALHWLRTMIFLLVTWVFFRAADFPTAWVILRKMLGFNSGGLAWVYTPLWFIAPALVLAHLTGRYYDQKRRVWQLAPNAIYTPALCLAVVLALLLLAPTDSAPFIYFQF